MNNNASMLRKSVIVPTRKLLTLAMAALALPLAGTAFAEMATMPVAAVGEVSLVLGKAWIHKPGEARMLVDVGTSIEISDRIETAANGHVHIRFVDQALVSVRPSSTLDIVRYDYDPAAPEASAVKLDLNEGVARAISGKAAHAAPQNFRMNTPIAAIGVRGTDFVVSSTPDSVRALVNQGIIVVAPFSSECSAEAFGPCSQNSLELTNIASQVVEISANTLGPVLLPQPVSGSPAIIAEESAAPAPAAEKQKGEKAELYADSVASRAVNRQIAGTKPVPPEVPVPPPGVDVVSEFTPDIALSTASLTDTSQLVWGRWSESVNTSAERITVAYDTATANGRQVTIGNDSHYALFRAENGSKMVQPGLGVLGFELNKAQAVYTTADGAGLMDVYGGQLSLDFNQKRFATSLQLGHEATGNIEFNDSGRISPYGYFTSRGENQAMAGSVSIDGNEAGYFFEKALQGGHVEGITLWGREP